MSRVHSPSAHTHRAAGPAVLAGLMVAPFEVSVAGFAPAKYFAASRGKALAAAWGSYSSYDPVPFGEFLRLARARRIAPTGRFGEPITVQGRPAFYVSENRQYVQFVWPGSDVVLSSHPLDVGKAATPAEADAVGMSPQGECTQSQPTPEGREERSNG